MQHGWEVMSACKILANICEGRRQQGRLAHRWEDDIKTDVKNNGEKLWTGFSDIRKQCIW